MLKLRASYGEVGNNAIQNSGGGQSYYPYQALYDLGLIMLPSLEFFKQV